MSSSNTPTAMSNSSSAMSRSISTNLEDTMSRLERNSRTQGFALYSEAL
jgi:hypothetical protein